MAVAGTRLRKGLRTTWPEGKSTGDARAEMRREKCKEQKRRFETGVQDWELEWGMDELE